jgi:hypothetical protein
MNTCKNEKLDIDELFKRTFLGGIFKGRSVLIDKGLF